MLILPFFLALRIEWKIKENVFNFFPTYSYSESFEFQPLFMRMRSL